MTKLFRHIFEIFHVSAPVGINITVWVLLNYCKPLSRESSIFSVSYVKNGEYFISMLNGSF
jgi:hypothetical protein